MTIYRTSKVTIFEVSNEHYNVHSIANNFPDCASSINRIKIDSLQGFYIIPEGIVSIPNKLKS